MSSQEKQKIVEMARIAARWAYLHPVEVKEVPSMMNYVDAHEACSWALDWPDLRLGEEERIFRHEYRAALVGALKTNVKIEV